MVNSNERRVLGEFMTPNAFTGGGTRFRSVRTLTSRLGRMSQATVTSLVDRLKIKGYIKPVSTDEARLAGFTRRDGIFGITNKGKEAIKK